MARLGHKTSFPAAVAGVVKPAGGYVCAVYAYNGNAAVRYLMIFDRATALAGGEAVGPNDIQVELPANGGVDIVDSFFTPNGLDFTSGIVFGVSTARGTYTAATAADHDTTFIWG